MPIAVSKLTIAVAVIIMIIGIILFTISLVRDSANKDTFKVFGSNWWLLTIGQVMIYLGLAILLMALFS